VDLVPGTCRHHLVIVLDGTGLGLTSGGLFCDILRSFA
jgi:hypothetical protein